MAGVWGQYGLEVTDNSLAQVVRQLRLALEKLQPDREFIQTLPRLGYRLTDGVKVEELSARAQTTPAPYGAAAGSEVPVPAASMTTVTDTGDEELEAPLIMAKRASAETASGQLPVLPRTLPRRWGLWLALPLWGGTGIPAGKDRVDAAA
ncbi:hypothetical protein D3C84_740510 [compost metagenome]